MISFSTQGESTGLRQSEPLEPKHDGMYTLHVRLGKNLLSTAACTCLGGKRRVALPQVECIEDEEGLHPEGAFTSSLYIPRGNPQDQAVRERSACRFQGTRVAAKVAT